MVGFEVQHGLLAAVVVNAGPDMVVLTGLSACAVTPGATSAGSIKPDLRPSIQLDNRPALRDSLRKFGVKS